MSETLPEYDLFAIRYAMRNAQRRDHFIGGDPHEGPMPMDYFLWVAKSPERTFVIDCGFTKEVADKRKRTFLRDPIDALKLVGVDADDVKDVIISHLHYDHVGNFHRFPVAQFHLQEPEMHYATGRYMRYPRLSHSFEVEDICGIVRLNFQQRVLFYNSSAELAPGISVHLAGGHSAGLQFVRVHTRRGWVVLAIDVSHFYENMESNRPFPTAFHVGQMLEGFDALRALAPSPAHIVPGHDPLVMSRYPAPSSDLEGIVVRLDVPPSTS
ncbi:N-acyl homoserine lactonase family protein [Aquabacter sp. CN5-332]|uniref:N-acyl homoserine lactonase family protein n=1 Tax=Aquabacter sp. CN5-332 TaxID=3156608 RepID=UPI0032B5F21D